MIGIVGTENSLLFSTIHDLKEIDLETGEVRTLIRQFEEINSMAYSHKQRYMYVSRFNTGNIVR